MRQELIFQPMGALALLTFIVLGLVPIRRFRASLAGQVTTEDFKYGETPRVPAHVAMANRAYMNLLEVPVLFYIGSLMYFVAGRVDRTSLVLAWSYVALRGAHSLIHVTYNNVFHRLTVFAIGNVVLMAFWALFFL